MRWGFSLLGPAVWTLARFPPNVAIGAARFQRDQGAFRCAEIAPVLKERRVAPAQLTGDDHAAARVTAGGRLSRAALAAWQSFGREPDRFTG
jgi:hypothetical protein